MKTIINFVLLTGLFSASGQASSLGGELEQRPPFTQFECQTGWGPMRFSIQHYHDTSGAGPAKIQGVRVSWNGSWTWSEVTMESRLKGYYVVQVQAWQLLRNGRDLNFSAYYSPIHGTFTLEQLQIGGSSVHVECEIQR